MILDIEGAFVRRTDWTNANLEGANLCDADLSHAILRGVNFKDAKLRGTILKGADLGDARNLTVEQLREAVIDEDTQLPPELRDQLLAEASQ